MTQFPSRRAAGASIIAALLPAAVAVLAALPVPAHAQYFGRNKVNYDAFDFRALKTEHFDVYFYPAESLATADAARMAERWFARHSTLLGFDAGRAPLIFYADQPDFQQTNVISGEIGEGTGGVTEGSRERVIMPHTGVYAETDHVLGHELVHVFQYRIAKGTDAGLRSLEGIPLWLIEGMAEYLSLGRDDPNTAMWLRDALRREDLPTLEQLTVDPDYFPYRYGQAVWAFVGGTYGDEAVGRLFRAALARGWEQGVRSALSMSSDSLSKAWHAAIRAQYAPTFSGRTAPDSTGRAVVRVRENGDQNVAPAVSPDGRRVAFFSSRDLFGIDLYVADVASGRVTRRLTSITADAHFDALSFINSSGSFSPDGDRLAVVTFAEGDHEIAIFRVSDGDVLRRITVRGVSAMSDPAWSPDGRRIAFSGSVGGVSDLYVYDLEANEARRLTSGREAELQPAWSPDGRTIAFATDRGPATDFSTLAFGDVRLATIPADGTEADIQLLRTFDRGKSINPQYAPDGSILFVSDQDGVSDIYRLDPSGSVSRVTRVATGVSGITDLSPAISVAKDGTIVFSVFTKAGFAIHAMEAPTAVAAGATEQGARVAGILPPARPIIADGGVARLLADDETGLIAPTELERTRVDNRLRLEYVAGPSVGVTFGGGGYGNGLGGGVGLGFRDMLGNHDLGVILQAQGDIKDMGGAVYYLNQKRRWGWGAQASHVPYAGVFATAEDVILDDGQGGTVPATVVVQQLQRVYFDNVDLLTQYPFSRTRRLEMSAGFQHIGFGIELDSQLIVGNQVVDRRRTGAPAGPGINLGRGAMALVGDNSFAAFTSPIAGSRWRLEVGGNAGDLNYQDALVDLRRYFFMRPFTLAFRGLHYGRYGRDAESEFMQPIFLGQPQLVRGYEAGTFSFGECSGDAAASGDCPEFTRLNGSRVAVVNAEFRIPLLGNDRFGLLSFPFLPTEISPFVDAGVAWTQQESPSFRIDRDTPDRVPVLSYGVTSRMNLFGYAVLEIFWAKPYHRPLKGSVWGFQLVPGW